MDNGLNLADEVLAHVDHEPQALRATNVAVSEDSLARVVNPTVGTLDAGIGLVSYARTCIINGKTGAAPGYSGRKTVRSRCC